MKATDFIVAFLCLGGIGIAELGDFDTRDLEIFVFVARSVRPEENSVFAEVAVGNLLDVGEPLAGQRGPIERATEGVSGSVAMSGSRHLRV